MPRFEYEGAVLARQEEDGFVWEHIRPRSLADMRDLLAKAAQAGSFVVPGAPRRLPERLRDKEVIFLDRSSLQNVIEHRHEDQVVSVETGMTVGQLDEMLAKSNQWFPVSAGRDRPVAEVIELGEGGCLEHGFGGPRDLVLGLSAVLSTGDTITCGGKVVKNVTGYDMQKLLIGSRGCLGVVGETHLRLFARPQSSRTVVGHATTAGEAFAAAIELIKSGLSISCLELVDSKLLGLLAEKDGSSPLQSVAALAGAGRAAISYAVLIQIHGQTEVVDDTIKEVRRRLRPLLGNMPDLDLAASDLVWNVLSELPHSPDLLTLSVAASATQMRALSEWLLGEGLIPPWQCRPGRGRANLYAHGFEQIVSLLTGLVRWCQQNDEQLVVAYADTEFEWRVRRLPDQDEHSLSLKRALKERFDPAAIMNPLVSL